MSFMSGVCGWMDVIGGCVCVCCSDLNDNLTFGWNVFTFDRGLRAATISAVKAATKRSMQLGGVPPEEIANKYNL